MMVAGTIPTSGATLIIQTNNAGVTPDILAYNSGHFYPGSNTREWWRYSGVTGARVFLAPSQIEATDDIAGRGDGVTTQAGFLSRKAALRAAPLNTSFINWPYFSNRYENFTLTGANTLRVNYAFSQMRQLGIDILVNITASQSFLTITDTNDWAGKWELWQHYYAQAFYLGRVFDVHRYQMYNEPNHSNAGGLTQADYLQRLQLASDAIQSALADVNQLYGKSLVPIVNAPVTAGSDSVYPSWGALVVTNRHVNFLGQTDSNFTLVHRYAYQQYGATGPGFGTDVLDLRNLIGPAMAPEPAMPMVISEFNVLTAANFDATADTLDTPARYARLGSIAVNLVKNLEKELYCFKFSQTDGDAGDNYPVRKNGMHYVDNDTAPYNIGGVTKAGEVWRLFNKGFAPGREQKAFTVSGSSGGLEFRVSYDPASQRYFVFSANDSATSTSLSVDVTALGIQENNRVLIEEVSESCYGTVKQYTRVLAGMVTTFTQPANSAWLITIPRKPQQYITPSVPTLVITPSDDATVKDGANKNFNYGTQTNLVVRNDPANISNRSAALLKFRLPRVYLPDVQLVVLSVNASTISTNATAQAFVYGITNDNWSQTNATWANTPNLRQNIGGGNLIPNNFINGFGDSALLQGQLVASSLSPAEQQIDVTEFIRTHTNYDASFLISQDPRWNLTLPSLAVGDTQPDGIQIVSQEGDGALSGPRLKFVRLKDTDGDGISDEAESTVFNTNPNLADSDGDGAGDLEEYFAGTNPNNSSSKFQIVSSTFIPDTGFRLTWSAVTTRSYRIFRATDLAGATWQQVYFGQGTNTVMTFTDPLNASQLTNRPTSFYRIKAE